jgi:two-component sensor histidine kinase
MRRDDAYFACALVGLGRARTVGEISDSLKELLHTHVQPAAVGTLLLQGQSDEEDPTTGGDGGEASKLTHPATSEIIEKLREGDNLRLGRGDRLLRLLHAPPETETAILLPCHGVGSSLGLCVAWPDAEIPDEDDVVVRLELVATTVGLALDRVTSNRRRQHLVAALDHRIRNVFAQLRSIGIRSAEQADSIDAFIQHYEGRLNAISRTHVAAIRGNDVSFDMIVREELLAQLIQDGPRATIWGPDILVSIDEAEILSLAIHELAANAVEFGAFAVDDGTVSIGWVVEDHEDGRILKLSWRETVPGGIDTRPERFGFGRTVIERMLPFQLGASVQLRFRPSGIECDMAIPLTNLPGADSAERAPAT